MLGLISKFDHALAKLEEALLALLLISMVAVASVEVLLRNIWDTGIDWSGGLLKNLTVLVGLLGAAVATSEGRHLNIDVVGRALRGRLRFFVRTVIGLFAIYVCVQLTRGGWTTFKVNFDAWLSNVPPGWGAGKWLRQELSEGTFRQWTSQVLLPFGFGLIAIHFVLRVARDLISLATGESWEQQLGGSEHADRVLDEMAAKADHDDPPDTGHSELEEADTVFDPSAGRAARAAVEEADTELSIKPGDDERGGGDQR